MPIDALTERPAAHVRWRAFAIAVSASIGTLLIAITLLLTFGWGLMRGTIERRLSASIGRTVRIAKIRRLDRISFQPLLQIEGVRVSQPEWAGPGDMATVRAARIRLPVLPLLLGRVLPEAISIDGLRLALIRDADDRVNWRRDAEQPSGAPPPQLGHMTLRDAIVTFDDAREQRRFLVHAAIGDGGLRIAGAGSLAGHSATILMTGAAVAQQQAWPFRGEIVSSLVSLRFAGRAAAPLDFGHFAGRIETRGGNLRDLDRIIDAGLPDTQPFRATALVKHDRPAWTISAIRGTIGRSDVQGRIGVHKQDDRTLLDGDLSSNGFDFADLATDAQNAEGIAYARITGPRLFPRTPIHLDKLRHTDATVRFDLRHLLFTPPSAFHSLAGTLTLDHGVLTVSPLVAGLGAGVVRGSMVVRHQQGEPLMILDLRFTHGRMEGLVTDAELATGPLMGRLRLRGHGVTIREAIARSSGTIGVAALDGSVDRRVALVAGSDYGRAITTNAAARTPLRCAVVRYRVADGRGVPAPLVVDTAVSRSDGSGSIDLRDERLALILNGRPKLAGGLKLAGPLKVGGTIKNPALTPPPHVASAGNILKMVGRAITGHNEPALAGDADCAGLAALAMR